MILRPQRIRVTSLNDDFEDLLTRGEADNNHGATDEDLEGRDEEIREAMRHERCGSKRKTAASREMAGKAVLEVGPSGKAARRERVPYDEAAVFAPSEQRVTEGKKVSFKRAQRLKERAKLTAGRLKEGTASVPIGCNGGPSAQMAKHGFLGKGGDTKRFWGTQLRKGMTFMPNSKESFAVTDNDRIYFFKSHDMGEGWKADLKELTDLVERLEDMYHFSIHDKQATRSAQAGEKRHKWWLFGVDTGYTNVAAPTKSYFNHETAAKEVRDSPALKRVSRAVELVIKQVFPDIWARYNALRAHEDIKFQPWFSIFHLIAFNLPHDEVSVFCDVHTDAKNLALGLCVIAPWGNFDPDVSYHLVLPTLGIVVAFGVGTWVAFPSALIPHGNLHGGINFELWSTRKGEGFELTGKVEGQVRRGSVVLFSQGNMVRRAEKGGMSAKQLQASGDADSGYTLDIFRSPIFADDFK